MSEVRPDGRYDTFLANVLEEGSLMLPKGISIVSWNYDSQIENAYKAYNHDGKLPLFEKNIQGEWPKLTNSGRIVKINGSAPKKVYLSARTLKAGLKNGSIERV